MHADWKERIHEWSITCDANEAADLALKGDIEEATQIIQSLSMFLHALSKDREAIELLAKRRIPLLSDGEMRAIASRFSDPQREGKAAKLLIPNHRPLNNVHAQKILAARVYALVHDEENPQPPSAAYGAVVEEVERLLYESRNGIGKYRALDYWRGKHIDAALVRRAYELFESELNEVAGQE